MDGIEQAASAPPSFQNRVDAVFGALGGSAATSSSEAAGWALSSEHVFRTGRDDNLDSSEEDAEEAGAIGGLDMPGEELGLEGIGEGERPSVAFCRALEREGEYDDVDELATGTMRQPGAGGDDARPHAQMEVLDESVWEQRARAKPPAAASADAAHSGISSKEALPAAQQQPAADADSALRAALLAAPRSALKGSGGDAGAALVAMAGGGSEEGEAGAGKKRVRFKDAAPLWVPPHRREGAERAQGQLPPPPEPPGPATSRPSGPGRGRGRGIPDHVRNPHKYTVYKLDTPITVGGGAGQLADVDDSAWVARAATAAAASAHARRGDTEEEEEAVNRHSGAVGGGIEFRPKAKSKPKAAAEGAGRPGGALAAPRGRGVPEVVGDEGDADSAGGIEELESVAMEEGSQAAEGMELEGAYAEASAPSGGTTFRQPRQRHRSFRTKGAGVT